MQVFFKDLETEIFADTGVLGKISVLEDVDHPDHVAGYSFVTEAVWPLILKALDQPLSFVQSQSKLKVFRLNYGYVKKFLAHKLLDSQKI